LAEFAAMSNGTIARKPAGLDHPSAAAIPVAGVTALQMVDALAPGEGDVVVAVGATGGVGSYLVQLVVRRGARVVAVCSAPNSEYAGRLGAVDVIDYTAGDLAESLASRYPDGVHAIADMAGDKEGLPRLAERIRPGGRFVSAVGSADIEALAAKEVGATNIQGRVNTAALATLAGMLERGEIRNPEIRALTLDQADEAMVAVASHHTRGKLVVLP
jgi:NADPH:quinone reductase-like Zn-dependent oxidoreductase